jgi:hypothetical protein
MALVLMQKGQSIAFFSQALGPKATAQSTYDKEAMTILQALKRCHHYFLGGQLIIKIDHQILKFMMTQRLLKGIQHKLLMKLLKFNYQIEYKKGNENKVADALSRKGLVYLKLQPFRHSTFGIHQSLKLLTKFYDPFMITEKIDQVDYRLQLPPSADTHPVFHVS